jgi:hypothetical protein
MTHTYRRSEHAKKIPGDKTLFVEELARLHTKNFRGRPKLHSPVTCIANAVNVRISVYLERARWRTRALRRLASISQDQFRPSNDFPRFRQ